MKNLIASWYKKRALTKSLLKRAKLVGERESAVNKLLLERAKLIGELNALAQGGRICRYSAGELAEVEEKLRQIHAKAAS